MTPTWDDQSKPEPVAVGFLGWVLVAVRALAISVVVFGGLAVMLLMRMIERPLCGMQRPVTPYLTVAVCRVVLWIMGLRVTVTGAPMKERGGMVANHSSWLDIFVLNARAPLYFVSKSEVANWPGIGWLARATGTLFIRRDRKDAKAQTELFENRLMAGHRMLFFPEGTSTDGKRVLPFKTPLFQAFMAESLRSALHIQAISMTYFAPAKRSSRFYGWWGDTAFGASLLVVLAQWRQGSVALHYHTPVAVAEHESRKTLAAFLEQQVKAEHRPDHAVSGL